MKRRSGVVGGGGGGGGDLLSCLHIDYLTWLDVLKIQG